MIHEAASRVDPAGANALVVLFFNLTFLGLLFLLLGPRCDGFFVAGLLWGACCNAFLAYKLTRHGMRIYEPDE